MFRGVNVTGIMDLMHKKDQSCVFCAQKIDGTEYLRRSIDSAIFFFILLNLEAWNLAGVYKIEKKNNILFMWNFRF